MGKKETLSKGERLIFWEKFSRMIDLGFPLIYVLDIIIEETSNQILIEIATRIKEVVESGKTFAEALREYPETFSKFTIKLIAFGEVHGNLDIILRHLVGILKTEIKYGE